MGMGSEFVMFPLIYTQLLHTARRTMLGADFGGPTSLGTGDYTLDDSWKLAIAAWLSVEASCVADI